MAAEAAVEDEVRTKAFSPGSVAAEFRALLTDWMTPGITRFGSGLRETSLATWTKAFTPANVLL